MASNFVRACVIALATGLALGCSGSPGSTTCSSTGLGGTTNDPCATGGSSAGGLAGANTTGGSGANGGTTTNAGGTTTTGGAPAATGGSGPLLGAVAIDAGSYHTCAVIGDGSVQCWGYNGYGELGDGTASNRLAPVAVVGLSGAQAVSAGGWFTCAQLADGTLACWGRNDKGQCGDGTTANHYSFVATKNISNVTQVSSSTSHSCALVSTDPLPRCWGDNTAYKLGTGTTADPTVPNPTNLYGLTGALSVSVGENHTCAVLTDNTVRCWGNDDYHQTDGGGSNVVALAAGSMHTCALLADHTVRCWGVGLLGQLGNGTLGWSFGAAVVGITNAIAIAAGGTHSCALLNDGTVRCWGNNGSGQLGDGSLADQPTPVAVAGLSDVIAISAGYAHTCALSADRTVKCWGSNMFGQLGDGTTVSRGIPSLVTGIPLGSGGTSGTGGASGSGGTSGTGGSTVAGGATATGGAGGAGGATNNNCGACTSSLALCANDATCVRCIDAESAGCSSNANYQAVVTCLCGAGPRCAAVPSCSPPPLPPRLIAPVSANQQGPQPTFKVQLDPTSDGSRVRICADRQCAATATQLVGGSTLTATQTLAPGTYFWSATGRRQLPNGQWLEGTSSSVVWEFVVGHGASSPLMGFGGLPDFDGDGLADIAISNDFDSANASNPDVVTIYRLQNARITRDEKYYSPTIGVSSATVYFPSFIRNVGDIDGDGFVDAVSLTNTSLTLASIGLYRGSAAGLTGPTTQQLGASTSDKVIAMQWTGDVNGDGYADLALLYSNSQLPITAPYQLLLMRGGINGLSAPDAPIALTGSNYNALEGLGDVNGDGYADVALSANTTGAYRTYVFLGSAQGFPSTPSYTFPGVLKVTALGDVDGDGRADTLMEQLQSTTTVAGGMQFKAFVVRGADSLVLDPLSVINYPQFYPKSGNLCQSSAGTCDMMGPFEPAGDVNGDGFADVLTSGNVDQFPKNRVYLYLGSASGLSLNPVREFLNPENALLAYDTYYGMTITGFGDINGDHIDDIAIVSGFIRASSSSNFSGLTPRLRIYTGTSAGPSIDPAYTISSNQNLNYNDDFGMRVCGLDGG